MSSHCHTSFAKVLFRFRLLVVCHCTHFVRYLGGTMSVRQRASKGQRATPRILIKVLQSKLDPGRSQFVVRALDVLVNGNDASEAIPHAQVPLSLRSSLDKEVGSTTRVMPANCMCSHLRRVAAAVWTRMERSDRSRSLCGGAICTSEAGKQRQPAWCCRMD